MAVRAAVSCLGDQISSRPTHTVACAVVRVVDAVGSLGHACLLRCCTALSCNGDYRKHFYLPAATPPFARVLVSGPSFALEGPGRSIQYTLSSMLFNVLPTILEIGESSFHFVAPAHFG